MTAKSRAALKSENASDFPDNSTQLISPADLRGQMDDVADSSLFPEDLDGLDVSDADVTTAEGTKALSEWITQLDDAIDNITVGGGSFIHQGSGAVSRSYQDRMRDTVHLLDYVPVAEHAAIFDESSTYDVLPHINQAIAAHSRNQGTGYRAGPRILLPRGKIRISAPIELKSTVTIEGHGGGGTADNGFTSIIEVAAGQHGIIVHALDTYNQGGSAEYAWAGNVAYPVGAVVSSTNVTFSGIYQCTITGPGLATQRPTHSSGSASYSDGYTWLLVAEARGGGGSLFKNFTLKSLGGATGHGIWMRARATCYDVYISGFAQNGYNIVATAENFPPATSHLQGNANNWRVYNGRIASCGGAGLFVDGEDANAGVATGVDCSLNGGWGFWDDSFLGNVFVGCHTNGNGTKAERQYNGFVYICIGNAALAATAPPGTDNTLWWQSGVIGGDDYHDDITIWTANTPYVAGALGVGSLVQSSNGGVYRCTVKGAGNSTVEPTHASGTANLADGYSWILQNTAKIWVSGDTTVVEGGCFKLYSNAAVLLACYAEAGQPAWIDAGALAIYPGFGFDNLTPNSRGWLWTGTGVNNLVFNGTDSGGIDWTYQLSAAGPTDFVSSFQHPSFSPSPLTEKIDRTLGALSLLYANTNTLRTMMRTLLNTTVTFGRSAPVPHALFVDRLFVGKTSTLGRQITNDSAAPTTGAWAQGDFVLNNAPTAGSPLGWRCIASGTPGSWETVPIDPFGGRDVLAVS